jgi:MFS family permease
MSLEEQVEADFGRGAALLGSGKRRTRVTRREVTSDLSVPPARVALVVLAATNLVMVAVMAIAPVHLTVHGRDLDLVGVAIGIHVAGMFAPSPISGWVADRIGPTAVAVSGVSLLLATGIAGAVIDQGYAFSMTVVLAALGIGWNCGVVGGSTLLAASIPTTLRPHVEDLGEVAMGIAAAGAPLAGMIVALGGFTALSLAGAVTAMMPPEQIERLLESPIHEVRAGALSIMDKQARSKRRPRTAEKNCSTCIFGARTGSTTGIWSISVLHTWSAATCSINRATSSTSWRAPKIYGNAALPLSAPRTSSSRAT